MTDDIQRRPGTRFVAQLDPDDRVTVFAGRMVIANPNRAPRIVTIGRESWMTRLIRRIFPRYGQSRWRVEWDMSAPEIHISPKPLK